MNIQKVRQVLVSAAETIDSEWGDGNKIERLLDEINLHDGITRDILDLIVEIDEELNPT